jgi:hypothetical protein
MDPSEPSLSMMTATHLRVFHRIRPPTRRSLGTDRATDSRLGGDRVEGQLRARGLKMAMDQGENHRHIGGPGAQ